MDFSCFPSSSDRLCRHRLKSGDHIFLHTFSLLLTAGYGSGYRRKVLLHHKDGCQGKGQYILSQYGGPDGEINASLRYLSQRYSIPYREVAGLLTDIATEEIAHFEMIATIVHQLTRDLTPEEIKAMASS